MNQQQMAEKVEEALTRIAWRVRRGIRPESTQDDVADRIMAVRYGGHSAGRRIRFIDDDWIDD